MRLRVCAATLLALLIAGGAIGRHPAVAQQPACLHGENETADQRTRRQQALRLTRDINTNEAAAFSRNNGFQPLDKLALTAPVPQGFDVHLMTDGRRYSFSVKATDDSCAFGYFSDESGRIYVGQGLR